MNFLNPEVDAEKDVQRLWYEYIEVEGPLVDWPTKASREIMFKGETGDLEYARRFLPASCHGPTAGR